MTGRWIRRLLDAALPGAEEWPGFDGRLRRQAPPVLRFGLLGACVFLAIAPLWVGPRRRPGPMLGDDDLDAFLLRARSSPGFLTRQCATLVQLVACFRAWEAR